MSVSTSDGYDAHDKKKESLCAAYADASTASYQYCTYCISDARSFSQCFCCQCHLLHGFDDGKEGGKWS